MLTRINFLFDLKYIIIVSVTHRQNPVLIKFLKLVLSITFLFKYLDKNINADNILSHSSFIPEKRTIEDLYKEDAENAEFYRIVTDDDEDIAISGLGLAEEHILAIE